MAISIPATAAYKMREIKFKQISLDQGLSQASVICILQDSKGFMWFGTQDGLNRYDGSEFTIYKPREDDSSSISHIIITALLEDRDGNIWVGTQGGGLNRFDRKTGTFTRFVFNPADPDSLSNNNVSALCEDENGRVWIGTPQNGLNRFDKKNGVFIRYSAVHRTADSPTGLDSNTINTIYKDHSGTLWVGTATGGLHRWEPETQQFNRYRIPRRGRSGRNDNSISTIYEDKRGNLWLGTQQAGLFRFDRKEQTFTPKPVPFELTRNLASNFISAVHESGANDFWIATRGGGLLRYDRDTGIFTPYLYNRDNPYSIKSNFIITLYEDRSGMLWAGTAGAGIAQFTCASEKFTHLHSIPNVPDSLNNNMVRALHEDRDGILWVGTQGGGLTKINRTKKKYTHYTSTNDDNYHHNLSGNIVRAIFEDSDRQLWIGTEGAGLNKFNRSTGRFTHYNFSRDNPNSLGSNNVYFIFQDSGGQLWIGTWGGGLNAFDPETQSFSRITTQYGNADSLCSNLVFMATEEKPGVFWIATGGGISRYDRNTTPHTFTNYTHIPGDLESLSNNVVPYVHIDKAGFVWVGTIGGGLNRLNPATGKFKHYNETHGLPNNSVYSILEDEDGRLWLSTNKGLSRFDPKTGRFRNYDHLDGLQSNEFNGGAAFKSSSGEMFFGGVNGLNSFHPADVMDNPYIPPIVITDFMISNRSVSVGPKGKSLLQSDISETRSIDLSYRHNVFSFEFSALSYIIPEKNRFSYKMDGFDENWIYSGTRRFVTYTNLAPRKYTFRVKGSNNDGTWNEEGTSIKIRIHPPFWRTPWAYAFYVFALLAILYGIRRFELQRERTHAKLQESELRARAMEAQARAIQAENQRKTHQLEEARKFQLSMLPETIPDYPGLEIAAYLETATEVGGDYYDLHIGENGALAVAVGDATGHGLKAATMVSVIKGLFCADEEKLDIHSFFKRANHTIRHMRLKNLYMALTLMEIKDDNVVFSSAAMPPTLLYRCRTKKTEKFLLKGMPLGAFSGASYQSRELTLQKGDTLLLYSDGLPELFNRSEEMFGYQRVEELFSRIAHLSPSEIIDKLVETAETFLEGKPQDDDITFLVIKYS